MVVNVCWKWYTVDAQILFYSIAGMSVGRTSNERGNAFFALRISTLTVADIRNHILSRYYPYLTPQEPRITVPENFPP